MPKPLVLMYHGFGRRSPSQDPQNLFVSATALEEQLRSLLQRGRTPLDEAAFPAVRLARLAGEAGGVVPALYNAANEEAVSAFVAGRLSFRGIVDLVARTLDDAPDLGAPTCVEDVLAAEKWAREHARGVIAGG